jgi:hemerythrin-like domain-containing protein
MCYQCGCEAEAVIQSLMDDHVVIAARIRRIREVMSAPRPGAVSPLTADLADTLAHHGATEEAGLFVELRRCGQAADLVARLSHECIRLVTRLSDPAVMAQSDRFQTLLADVVRYARIEDDELYPLALQYLPNEYWGPIENVHQLMLTA